MGTLERNVTIRHELGPAGRLTLKGVTGPMRVRAIPGTEAVLHINYKVRAADQASAERALEQSEVRVERGEFSLLAETPERRLSSGLAWLFGGTRVSATLFAEVPVGTRVQVETVSGRIEADGLAGEQRYRSVSGAVSLTAAAREIDVSTVSGAIQVDAIDEVQVRADTVSGAVWARAPLFHGLRLNTTSGDIRLAGDFSATGSYRADSVSGLLELATSTGMTIDVKTLSGRVRSDVPHRLDGARGRWRTTVGDGAAYFRFDSMSGDLRLREPIVRAPHGGPATDGTANGRPPAASGIAEGANAAANGAPSTAAHPNRAPATQPADGAPAAAEPANAEPPDAWRADEAADPTEDGVADAAEPMASENDRGAADDELALLRAVERGELSVEEAAARLARSRR